MLRSTNLLRCLSKSLKPCHPLTDASRVAINATELRGRCKYSTQAALDTPQSTKVFPKLFRNSAFVGLGDLRNVRVKGRIIQVKDDDLYIDFGGKFHCVCQRPMENSEKYRRGVNVLILLKSFELSTRFLGAAKNTTLLEADAELIGLYTSRKRGVSPSTREKKADTEISPSSPPPAEKEPEKVVSMLEQHNVVQDPVVEAKSSDSTDTSTSAVSSDSATPDTPKVDKADVPKKDSGGEGTV